MVLITYATKKPLVSLHIRAVSPEPSLFPHMNYGSRQRVRPKIRYLAPLDDCACVFEEWIYGGQKVPKSHVLTQLMIKLKDFLNWQISWTQIRQHNHGCLFPQSKHLSNCRTKPTSTQISLGIRPIWSESSLSAQWVAKDPRFLHPDTVWLIFKFIENVLILEIVLQEIKLSLIS